MALGVTIDTEFGVKTIQPNFAVRVTLAGDDDYPDGGYPLGTILSGASYLPNHTIIHVIATEDGNYRYAWDRANQKLKFLNIDTGAQIAGGTDVQAASAIEALVLAE
ncbi:MAG: hypothetical protein GTN69_06895 [Armatimonadetes bacterium]|nr:hypothetical protein [Armatimonadota bacterium]